MQTATRRPATQYGRSYQTKLASTSATTVLTVPVGGRNVLLNIAGSVTVTSATTIVTIEAGWTDPVAATSQTRYMTLTGTTTALNAHSTTTGTYGFESGPLFLEMGTTLTVTATAGTANQVTVTLSPIGA